MGVDMATSGCGAPQLGDLRLRQDRGESAEAPLTPMLFQSRLCERGAEREWRMSKRVKGR